MSDDTFKVLNLDGDGIRSAPSVLLIDLLFLVMSELMRRVDESESRKNH